MKDILNVFWEKEIVGKIIREKSKFSFRYAEAWLDSENSFPISISLPLQEKVFDQDISEAFFGNLLPESEVRNKIARLHGFSEKNDYALLNAIGGECAGALMIISEDRECPGEGSYSEISINDISESIKNQKNRPMIIGKNHVRLSLAGVQEKLPVYVKDKHYYLPYGINASNYIIKPAIRDYKDSLLNEAFCMKLAKRLDMDVADINIVTNDCMFLLIKRYDRIEKDQNVVRLHQEDFCQALGVSYNQKYESEGGPGLLDCFKLIDDHSSQPAFDKKRLIELIVFNYYIGNSDAHAKNVSFLYKDNKIVLAPFYDLLSTLIYKELTDKMAMKIGGENRLNWIRKRHWQRLAESIDVKFGLIVEILDQLGKKMVIESEKVIEEFKQDGFDTVFIEKIVSIIKEQKEKVG